MSDEKNNGSNFAKQAMLVGGLATATLLGTEACKTKEVDPTPPTTDTTKVTPPVDSTAIKDSIKAAQDAAKKEQMRKDSVAAREKVQFGGNWGEFYGGPIATGTNPDTQQPLETDADRQRFNDYVSGLRGKFKTIAVEPAFISRDLLPEASARVNFTGVDPNNATHRPLVDRLNAIEASGKNAYLKQNGQKVSRQNLQLLDFRTPEVVDAVKAYVQEIAGRYNSIFGQGAGNYEEAAYNFDPKVIAAERDMLKAVGDMLKSMNKPLIMGDLQTVDPKAAGKPEAANMLSAFVAKNVTKKLHFYLPPTLDLQKDKWIRYYAQQDGAETFFTALNTPVTEQSATTLKTNVGILTNRNNYPTVPNTPDTYFTNPYAALPQVASASVFITSGNDLLNRADPAANLGLAGKNLRLGAAEDVPAPQPSTTLYYPGAKQLDGLVAGELTKIAR